MLNPVADLRGAGVRLLDGTEKPEPCPGHRDRDALRNNLGSLDCRELSAAAITRKWFMLVPSASASFSIAAFSETGKRSEKVDTLVVIFLSPLVLPPGFGAEFRIGRVHLCSLCG